MPQIILTMEDQQGCVRDVAYQLSDGAIAALWFKKLSKICRLPLDENYTQRLNILPEPELERSILDDARSLGIEIGDAVDREQCNRLHDITVRQQYDHPREIRDVFHRMHKNLHLLENMRSDKPQQFLAIGWGEREGMLKGAIPEDRYEHYVPTQPGSLYLSWAEFGKTPYQFWKNGDVDTDENFFVTAKPHLTFGVHFSLCIGNASLMEPEFNEWFSKYEEPWRDRYDMGWNDVHNSHSILLATPCEQIDVSEIVTVRAVRLGDI